MTYRPQGRGKAALVYLMALALVVAPLRRAEAFVAPAAAPVLITAGGPVVWTIAALSALAAAGVAILAVKFKDSGGADVATVHVNPKSVKPVPAGWSAGLPGEVPVPPGTTGSITQYECPTYGFSTGACASRFDTIEQACIATMANANRTYSDSSATHCWDVGHNADYGAAGVYTTCPTGYTLTSGTCNLTNAAVVPYPSDGVGQTSTVPGTVTDDSRDPDNTLPSNVTKTASRVTVKEGTKTTTIDINADGGVTVTQLVPNGNGTSTKIAVKTSAPDAGATDGGTRAVGVEQSVVSGEGDSSSETPATSCAGGPCATEATQLANKALLQDLKDNGVKTDEQAATWATAKSAADTKITAADAAISNHTSKLTTIAGGGNSSGLGVSGLSNYVAPSSGESTGLESAIPAAASCQALSGSAFGRSWSVDICPVVNATRVILEWGLYVMTLAYVFFALLRPRERGS